jgi:hypothetical protein
MTLNKFARLRNAAVKQQKRELADLRIERQSLLRLLAHNQKAKIK